MPFDNFTGVFREVMKINKPNVYRVLQDPHKGESSKLISIALRAGGDRYQRLVPRALTTLSSCFFVSAVYRVGAFSPCPLVSVLAHGAWGICIIFQHPLLHRIRSAGLAVFDQYKKKREARISSTPSLFEGTLTFILLPWTVLYNYHLLQIWMKWELFLIKNLGEQILVSKLGSAWHAYPLQNIKCFESTCQLPDEGYIPLTFLSVDSSCIKWGEK